MTIQSSRLWNDRIDVSPVVQTEILYPTLHEHRSHYFMSHEDPESHIGRRVRDGQFNGHDYRGMPRDNRISMISGGIESRRSDMYMHGSAADMF